MSHLVDIPISPTDEINKKILEVSEDRLQGFQKDPIGEISRRTEIDAELIIRRIQAMLKSGTIRRVRQTLLATNLAEGALVAWKVDEEKLDDSFNYLFQKDPFSGHVVTRSTDKESTGSNYRLWTTLKVPQGFSLRKHCELLTKLIGANAFKIMPAKGIFVLGVGHMRRRGTEYGAKADEKAQMTVVKTIRITDEEWKVLRHLKREFASEEIKLNLWEGRAKEAGVSLEQFYKVAEDLSARGLVGRFSTFLEHVKKLQDGSKVTKFNALFHWRVPEGMQEQAGCEVGRHDILTHAYWREGGEEFSNVNIMAVAHGMEKEKVYLHKEAIDKHLEQYGIPVLYTNVFWGGRSEIKPSEIDPQAYAEWLSIHGVKAESMLE